ncbi:MAG: hypothetical protein WAU81_12610 [Candidatus Aminicenantales bacterium]
MNHQTDFANSKNWLNDNIAFSYSSFYESAIRTTELANFSFIFKPFFDVADHSLIASKEEAVKLSTGLEMELKAWDKLSDEAFIILENSI